MYKKYSCKRPANVDISYLPFQYYFYTGTHITSNVRKKKIVFSNFAFFKIYFNALLY